MTQYFGVLGNRDHIKIQGEKVPYFEFLDRQPDGWLSSLVYLKNTIFPKHSHVRMLDCGAWSYKALDAPKLGKRELTADVAVELYEPYARRGDFVIAPDHILLDGSDVEAREEFNRESASRFLEVVKPSWRPMAVIHGNSVLRRLCHMRELITMGYHHLCIGGVAARASQKALVLDIVGELRRMDRSVYLHVLGLSSPSFVVAWDELGIDSCDGSSHFKQAFTGGAFFVCESDGKLRKYDAAHTQDEPITAPACSCVACATLRDQGIDTRRFGSNEHNMGRAVHNQNMLMRAHQIVRTRTEWALQ